MQCMNVVFLRLEPLTKIRRNNTGPNTDRALKLMLISPKDKVTRRTLDFGFILRSKLSFKTKHRLQSKVHPVLNQIYPMHLDSLQKN